MKSWAKSLNYQQGGNFNSFRGKYEAFQTSANTLHWETLTINVIKVVQ